MHLEQNAKEKSSVSLSCKKDQYDRRIPKIYTDFSVDLFRDVLHMQEFLRKITISPAVFNKDTIEKNFVITLHSL